MDTESLQILSASALATGVIFAGLGGYGVYYFSRIATSEHESRRASGQAQILAKLAAAQRNADELEQRLRATPPSARIARPPSRRSPPPRARRE